MCDEASGVRRLAAPIFSLPIASSMNVDLIVAQAEQGIIGSFDLSLQGSLARTEAILSELTAAIKKVKPRSSYSLPAPYAVRLCNATHRETFESQINLCFQFQAPIAIFVGTSSEDTYRKIKEYGGNVFCEIHDLSRAATITRDHADGLIVHWSDLLKCGLANDVFGLITELKEAFGGTIVVTGAAYTGSHILALQALGADLVCLQKRLMTENSIQGEPIDANVTGAIRSASSVDIRRTDFTGSNFFAHKYDQSIGRLIREIVDEYQSAIYGVRNVGGFFVNSTLHAA